ncbi:MAG: MarR family transcriptional regulator [Lachnospiraceae bacterium]|nr:MarR family transcriptional regulator [Lachnospiraceae bacterium]
MSSNDKNPKISYECGALLKQIHDMTEKHANNSLRGIGLTLSQMHVLLALHNEPGQTLSMKELEKHLLVAQSTTFGLISRLEQKGFVEIVPDAADRRVKLVKLTASGNDCVSGSDVKRREMETLLLSSLTASEQKEFFRILTKVRDTLRSNTVEGEE